MTTTDEMIGCLRAGNKYGILNDVMANEIAARLVDLEARLAATAARWNPVEKLLPELELPVWLYIPETKQSYIGCRSEGDDGWVWCNCRGDFWWDGKWKTATAEEEVDKPSHWRYLPNPPEGAM